MMVGPIVTSALLMDLAEVAEREGMVPLDPWEGGPIYLPACCHHATVLRLDGSIETVLDPSYHDPDWSTIAAARFEDAIGQCLNVVHDEWDFDVEHEEEEIDDVVVPVPADDGSAPKFLTRGA